MNDFKNIWDSFTGTTSSTPAVTTTTTTKTSAGMIIGGVLVVLAIVGLAILFIKKEG